MLRKEHSRADLFLSQQLERASKGTSEGIPPWPVSSK